MAALRYIDLVLLWLTVPLALALGAPATGVLAAAIVWTAQRVVAVQVDRRARARESAREALGLNVATMIARMWLIGALIVVLGVAVGREHAVAAALVLVAAFTIALAATLVARGTSGGGPQPGAPRHA